jgi:amidophosphoribosyltransferase
LDLVPKLKASAIQEWFGRLPGHVGIGNVRYTTSGRTDEKSLLKDTQPVVASKNGLKVAISFNGNIVNALQLEKEIRKENPGFSYECDANIICHKFLIELAKRKDLASAAKACMQEIEGAFSVAGITKDGEFFAFKDPHGIRPLCAGHSEKEKIYAFSSETVGLDINGFCRDFEVEPGEFVVTSEGGFERERLVKGAQSFLRLRIRIFRQTRLAF